MKNKYRLPIRYRSSGEKGYINVTAENYVAAAIILTRIDDNSENFTRDGKIQIWEDFKTKRGGRWVNAE